MSNKSVEFLKDKFQKDEIYVLIGKVLLAMNPYKTIDINTMFSECDIKSAHVFSIAKEARENVLSRSQSIIITGETGAGKTEATKHIIGYLCKTAHKNLMIALNSAAPILNAFGNAKTAKNQNSSRYCKFVEIHYNSKLEIIGGHIQHFMLETSRILEYHIFGTLLIAPNHKKNFLKLDDPLFETIDRNPPMSFEELDKAFDLFFSQVKKNEIYQFLGGVFCLSKINFQNDASDYSTISSDHALDLAAQLLSFDRKELTDALTIRKMTLPGENGEKISMQLSVAEAIRAQNSLIKTIYVNFHGWLVRKINNKIDPGYQNDQQRNYIGILDMPGFECFTINSFEQLMINYANESIQLFCLKSIVKENSLLDKSNHKDVIELIENPEIGILSLLDNASNLQLKCANFAEIVTDKWPSSLVLNRKKLSPSTSFTIRHYVSDVTYQTEHFIEKNTEFISESVLKLGETSLRKITDSIVSLVKPNKRFVSEGVKLKQQLKMLLRTLDENGSNFIRCIKPNDLQCSDLFDESCVHKQLLTTGTDFLIQNEVKLWQLGENPSDRSVSSSNQFNKQIDSQKQLLASGSYFIIENDTNHEQHFENLGDKDANVANKSDADAGGYDVKGTHKHKRAKSSSIDNERFDKYDHWVEFDSRKSGTRCKYNKCNKTVHTYCSKCKVHLCSLRDRNCFKSYHH